MIHIIKIKSISLLAVVGMLQRGRPCLIHHHVSDPILYSQIAVPYCIKME